MMCAVSASPPVRSPPPGAVVSVPAGTTWPDIAPGAAWQIAAILGP